MKIFTTKPKWYQFWNPWSGFRGGLVFLLVMYIGFNASEALGVTEYDERANGYTGYDYDNQEWIEVDENPAGGYDVYNYETREHSEIESNPSGGFTVHSSDN